MAPDRGHSFLQGIVRAMNLRVLWLAFFVVLTGCGSVDDPGPAPWFADVSDSLGLLFTHEAGLTGARHMPEIMGSGVALVDVDSDGDLDVYFINGNELLPEAGVSARNVNRLFRQNGDGSFEDMTAQSGLGDGGYGMGVAAVALTGMGVVFRRRAS